MYLREFDRLSYDSTAGCLGPGSGNSEKETADEPQLSQSEAVSKLANVFIFHQVDAALGFADQKPDGEDDAERGDSNDRCGRMQSRVRRQPLDQLTAESARHRRDVEPSPLLIDERVAGAGLPPSTRMAPQGMSDRQCIGCQQQSEHELIGAVVG